MQVLMPISHLWFWLTKVHVPITSGTEITLIPAQNNACCSARGWVLKSQERVAFSERWESLENKFGAKVTAQDKDKQTDQLKLGLEDFLFSLNL